jgi:hypothetical protein
MVLKKEIMKTQNQDIERAAEYRQVRETWWGGQGQGQRGVSPGGRAWRIIMRVGTACRLVGGVVSV